MAGVSTSESGHSRRASKWRKAFKTQDPVERLQNICRISHEYDAAHKQANDDEKRRLKVDMVYAVGDRSTAIRVIAVSKFTKSLIDKATEHLEAVKANASNDTIVSPDKRGTRADQPGRFVRATGFSVTHLLALALVGDTRARQTAFNQCIDKKWTIDELKKYIKQSGIGMPKAAKIRPTRLTYATHKHASELNEFLIALGDLEHPASSNAIKKSDRSAARQNCINAIAKLSEVKLNLKLAVQSLAKLEKILATDSGEVQNKSGNGRSGAKKK